MKKVNFVVVFILAGFLSLVGADSPGRDNKVIQSTIEPDPLEKVKAENRLLSARIEQLSGDIEVFGQALSSLGRRGTPTIISDPGNQGADLGVQGDVDPLEKWSFSGEIRDRFEMKRYDLQAGRKFASNREYIAQRSRFSMTYAPDERSRVVLRFQDRRNFGENGTNLEGNGANTELNLIYFDYKDLGFPGTTLRLGRQELNYANRRVLSSSNTSNQGRTFDALKWSWDFPGRGSTYDFFLTRVKEAENEASNDVDMAGIYARLGQKKDRKWDLYLLESRDGKNDQDLFHLGFYHLGREGRLNWEAQGGLQEGEKGDDRLSASALLGALGYRVARSKDLRLGLEYEWASGDDNPGDGKVKTYEVMYGAPHTHNGFADIAGYRNLIDLAWFVSIKPGKESQVKLTYHTFRLDQAGDNLYNKQGVAYTRDAGAVAGANGKEIGDEFDAEVNYDYSRNLKFCLRYGLFSGGELVERQYSLLKRAEWLEAAAEFKF